MIILFILVYNSPKDNTIDKRPLITIPMFIITFGNIHKISYVYLFSFLSQ